ncbi:MAG: GNAT family N-acetyltransferase [Theionarchaea archaeon]|nr:GNAT family N-acetyltransferase [Theionarchaea archaeon]
MEIDTEVRLEPAREEDAPILADICKKAFHTDCEVGAPGPGVGGPPGYDSPEAQVRFMGFLDYFKIVVNDALLGGIMVGSAGKTHKVLERIFVDPSHHRNGIGTRACEILWDLYPDVQVWTLGTPEWNTRTSGFYEKLGFNQIGWDLGNPDWRGRWYQWIRDPSASHELAKVSDLRAGMKNVTIEGEIVEKSEPRPVRSRRGEPLSVSNAALKDETGRVVLVLWNQQIGWIGVGDKIRVENGYADSYRGIIQLSVGRIGRLIVLI